MRAKDAATTLFPRNFHCLRLIVCHLPSEIRRHITVFCILRLIRNKLIKIIVTLTDTILFSPINILTKV